MSSSEGESNSWGRIKVLLIDDEAPYLNALSKRLKRRNFHTILAFNGTQGIQAVRYHDFDVAVLDLKMDDMDGIEVLKILKKLAPQIEVIMLTGHGSEQAAREGIELGAFDYLIKPCELEELIEKIELAASKKDSEI
jgi:DNA-binding response OmpR family regulator